MCHIRNVDPGVRLKLDILRFLLLNILTLHISVQCFKWLFKVVIDLLYVSFAQADTISISPTFTNASSTINTIYIFQFNGSQLTHRKAMIIFVKELNPQILVCAADKVQCMHMKRGNESGKIKLCSTSSPYTEFFPVVPVAAPISTLHINPLRPSLSR